MRDARFGLVGMSMVALLGCGGGGGGSGPAAKPGTPNPAGAMTVAAETSSLVDSLNAGDGQGMSDTVVAVSLSGAQQIVSPPAGAGAFVTRASAETITGPGGGTADCDATGCVYHDYVEDTDPEAFTMNGSVKATASGEVTHIKVDIDMTAIQNGTPLKFTIDGDLDVSPTLIDGQLTANGSAKAAAQQGVPTITYNYYQQVKYNAVTLSDGTPTGGSIYAKWGITLSGIPGAEQANQVYDGTVTF
jgi:hypothetical protein